MKTALIAAVPFTLPLLALASNEPVERGDMKSVMLLMLLSGQVLSAAAYSGIDFILGEEGSFHFTDGSSIYSFFDDGRFLLEPVGFSGRAVEGTWTSTDFTGFIIRGTWTWYNGISSHDDFREMTMLVTLLPGEPVIMEAFWQGERVPVYEVYFTIEKLVPTDRENSE